MITWDINPHIRNGAHCRNILCRMMAHSQSPIADPSADSNQFYIGVGVCHIHLTLLITSCRKKACRRNRIRFLSAFCQSGCNAYQILLCDSCFYKLLRIGVCKRCKRSAPSGITAECDNIVIFFCSFHQYFTDHLFICCFSHYDNASSAVFKSFIIVSYSSVVGTL